MTPAASTVAVTVAGVNRPPEIRIVDGDNGLRVASASVDDSDGRDGTLRERAERPVAVGPEIVRHATWVGDLAPRPPTPWAVRPAIPGFRPRLAAAFAAAFCTDGAILLNFSTYTWSRVGLPAGLVALVLPCAAAASWPPRAYSGTAPTGGPPLSSRWRGAPALRPASVWRRVGGRGRGRRGRRLRGGLRCRPHVELAPHGESHGHDQADQQSHSQSAHCDLL